MSLVGKVVRVKTSHDKLVPKGAIGIVYYSVLEVGYAIFPGGHTLILDAHEFEIIDPPENWFSGNIDEHTFLRGRLEGYSDVIRHAEAVWHDPKTAGLVKTLRARYE